MSLPRSTVTKQLILLRATAGVVFALTMTAAAQVDQGPTGLDALDEGRVLSKVTDLGLGDLLRHAIEADGVSPDDADVYLANLALARLTGDVPVPAAERQALVLDIAGGVDELISREPDEREVTRLAGQMLSQASVLIDRGIGEEVRLLEYFGDNPDRRRYVGTVAEAVAKLLNRSADLYEGESTRLADLIVRAGQPEQALAAEAQRSARQARSLATFADYYRVLGTDPDVPQRINLAEDVAQRLASLNTSRNPSRGFVQLMLGKVNQARGNATGREQAVEYFEQAITNEQNPARLFDAYFGRAVTTAQLGQADEAAQQLATFQRWFDQQPADALPGRDALMLVAAYRVAEAAASTATTDTAKQAADDQATQLLVELVEQHEGYRPIVTGQLLARTGDDDGGEIGELTPLVLDAIVDKGRVEAAEIAAGEDGDRAAIERGVEAAEELAARAEAGAEGVDQQAAARNTFLAALMTRTLGDDLGAAELFVRYGDLPAAEPDRRLSSYRQAMAIVDQVRRQSPAEADSDLAVRTDAVEAKLLPALVDDFNEVRFAFDLANRRHRAGELTDAVTYYAQVPADDPRKPSAERLQFLAMAESASKGEADPAAVSQAVTQGEAAVTANEQAASAASGSVKEAYQLSIAETKVAPARLALNELADSGRASRYLAGIEQDLQGIDAARGVLEDALPLRFQAQAASGDVDGATADLLALLEQSDPVRGFRYIEQFRDTLSRAYDAAVRRGDEEQRKSLTLTRAAVTPKLVDWIESSDDPAYRKYAYTFRTLDAETQYQAALEESGGDRRTERLRVALDRYRQLAEAEQVRQFRNLIDGLTDAQRETVQYDPNVLLNQARIHFELGEYEQTRNVLGRLLSDRTLGDPMRLEAIDGVTREVPNDDFWEAQLRYAEASLRTDEANRDDVKKLVQRLDALNGDAVDATKWADEFAALRQELGL